MGNLSSLWVIHWFHGPIKMVSRCYLISDHLHQTSQTRSCIFSVQLHCLDVTSVSQVRGGHSVQWQVGAGEPSCERRLQADGGGGHEHICQLEQGWLEVRKIHLKLTAMMQWSNDFDCISGIFFGGGCRELRSLVIEMVMSTDMSCHFQQIKTMKNALSQTDKSELKTRPFRDLHTTSINMTKTLILQILLKIFYRSNRSNNLPHLQAK